MTRYVISPRAQSDIEDIWDYTVERWNSAQAERYIRAFSTRSKPSPLIQRADAHAKKSRELSKIRRRFTRDIFPSDGGRNRYRSCVASTHGFRAAFITIDRRRYRVGTGFSPR
jgi:plasmid stabilization system protein ParE